ncbi:unnamed protein product [Bursaphelenchus xylophilus]|uniref:(pine wood nematode) hypothetical protein n=1 Tax=Bursaphelenchus xylophilus TaxID=6326 RepID=A0A1I7RUM9_BURXY|nr:unnamed protein product [Bursaphelenchus xylophilus]CAG9114242.1 unnamed protein product [Bursaphelenchus xylophilus]
MIGAKSATVFDCAHQRLLLDRTAFRAIQHAVDEILHICHVDMHIKVEFSEFQSSHVSFRHKFPSHHEAIHFVKEAFDYVHTHPVGSVPLRPEHENFILRTFERNIHQKWIDLGEEEDHDEDVVIFEGFVRLPKEVQKMIIAMIPSEHSDGAKCTVVSDLIHIRMASKHLRSLGNEIISEHILSFDCVAAF